MTQKIKLMSEQQIDKYIAGLNPPTMTLNQKYVEKQKTIANYVLTNCEQQAFEKLKQACKWFYINITRTETSLRFLSDSADRNFEIMFQQFLKEQYVKSDNEESKTA